MKNKILTPRSGFTLLEMVIVMGIIAVLAGTAITLMGNFGDGAKLQRTTNDMSTIKSALDLYRTNSKNYPTTEQGLDALVKKPTVAPIPRSYVPLVERVPLDGWNNPFIYARENNKVKIYSVGPDGLKDTEDDIYPE